MYIPDYYLMSEREEILAFMNKYSFATIVTVEDNYPTATHLPFVVSNTNDKVVLTSHFSKANKQWAEIERNSVLVIFSEPHAYISPSHYEKEQNVPTWNYLSVHVYGKGRIISEDGMKMKVLEQMIDSYEPEYKKQWGSLSKEYKNKMLKGIIAFDITVEEIQAKEKLSQNKLETERQSIINRFSESTHENEKLIAEYMKRKEKRKS